MGRVFALSPDINIGSGQAPVIIAGPCVIESDDICRRIAGAALAACQKLGLPYIFKSSFDKANRSSPAEVPRLCQTDLPDDWLAVPCLAHSIPIR